MPTREAGESRIAGIEAISCGVLLWYAFDEAEGVEVFRGGDGVGDDPAAN